MIQIYLGDNVYLFKHSIRYVETSEYVQDIYFSNVEKARYLEHDYSIKKKEYLGSENEYLLLWFERVSNGLKEGEKYYWKDSQTKEMQEITHDEYESLKSEYNYFIVIDTVNNSVYSYNTSDNQKNIVHKNLIKTFLEIKNFEINDIIDFEELKNYVFNTMKLRYKNTKQTRLEIFGKNVFEELRDDFSSEFDFEQLDLIFKNRKNIICDENSYEKFLSQIVKKDVDFILDGIDKKGNKVKIENKKMHKKVEIAKERANHADPLSIYNKIKEYFMESLDE